ncbi:MAG: amidohydrolase [Planctomycetaceae bacterium]|nr:amidohydrolase [Planctomycetaceae bacterium]
MTSRLLCGFQTILLLLLIPFASSAVEPAQWAESHVDGLIPLYKHLHTNPELSLQEVETSKLMAKELEAAGIRVTTNVGGYGVVGVLENGPGKRLLIRTDMDALPIVEETGLPYASTVQAKGPEGVVGVMHACGHDVHMTNFIGVARYLAENRDRWTGTILFVAQPAEEGVKGAKAMLDDGLYERFGKPDFALALHVSPKDLAGTVVYRPGFSAAASDGADIVVRGAGGHGARPHETKDPIVQAAQLILALQTIVSRDLDPLESAVITVGAISGGTRANVIPETCHLKVTIRSYSEDVRKQLHAAVEQRARGIAAAMGAPAPEVTIWRGCDPVYNDPELVQRVLPAFRRSLGEENVREVPPTMTSEDFGMFARGGVPTFMFRLGTATEERLKADDGSCSLHTPQYRPEVRPALVTGITAMSSAALELLSKD